MSRIWKLEAVLQVHRWDHNSDEDYEQYFQRTFESGPDQKEGYRNDTKKPCLDDDFGVLDTHI